MSVMNLVTNVGLAAARELRAVMRGQVVVRGDEAYATTRPVWNGAVLQQPALFALCETPKDVREAVITARVHDIPVSVRGTGHDWVGRSLRHEGLVLDLAAMRQVEVDPTARIATVAGGATAGDVIAAAEPHGLVAVTGAVGSVGMAGLTLGGGYGPLTSKFGLALDNLLSVEIVLADGQIATASPSENSDLFWVLRGGGGNFGVVTSMRIRLHRVHEVLAGLILFPWSHAEAILHAYAAFCPFTADELSVMVGVLSGPDGSPVVFLLPTWCGERTKGEQVIADLRCLGPSMFANVAPMPYSQLLRMFDAHAVKGRYYALQTRWLPQLTPGSISAIVGAGGSLTSRLSIIAGRHFCGMPTRVPSNATAFGMRQEHFMFEIVASWEPGIEDDGSAHRRWTQDASEALAPFALPGGYANLLSPEDHEQIAWAYGSNYHRLLRVKQRYDPDGMFSSAIPLPSERPQTNR